MKKLAVLIGGWHYPYELYKTLSEQRVPEGWEIDYFCIGHRLPEDQESISEKDFIRNYNGDNQLMLLDKVLYKKPLTTKHLSDWGWEFMLEDNTMGNYEFFNQWALHYDYKNYDIVFLAHDDNLILNNNLFYDILGKKTDLIHFQGPLRSRDLTPVNVVNNLEWHFLSNGFVDSRSPRGSFGFYTKFLLDKIGGKFSMEGVSLQRLNEKSSPTKHNDLDDWNNHDKIFMKQLYDAELADDMRFLSVNFRVSPYCIEGERGFTHLYNAISGKFLKGINLIQPAINKFLIK